MKRYRQVGTLLLSALLVWACVTSSVFATPNTEEPINPNVVEIPELELSPELEALNEQFETMSNEELNAYISKVVSGPQTRGGDTVAMKAAWLAAAEIAINKGYKCAGTLVKFSVLGSPYRETNGIFKSKIKASSAYARWLKKSNKPTKQPIIFSKAANSDLFYSLHECKIRQGAVSSQGAMVYVYDYFDFNITDMGGLFTTLVNDWAALCTYAGVLNEIDVYIDFYY